MKKTEKVSDFTGWSKPTQKVRAFSHKEYKYYIVCYNYLMIPNNQALPYPSGFLLIDKPSGPTSHDIINNLRHLTGIQTIGHAGTLDPLASGLLIVAIGRTATKQIPNLVKQDKVYKAIICLGGLSDTDDSQGKIQPFTNCHQPTKQEIKIILNSFRGEQNQIPPMYSAKKIHGERLYKLARKGQVVQRQPNLITIYNINLLHYEWPTLSLEIHCSAGTYIRAIARDLGKMLGCGGYLCQLRRTKIGNYSIQQAVTLEKLTSHNWTKFLFNL